MLRAVSEAMFEYGKLPILFCSSGTSHLTLQDVYLLARHIIDTPLRYCRIAFLHDMEPALESTRFIETLAADRGLTLAAFYSVPDALHWLAGAGSPGAGRDSKKKKGARKRP